MNTTKIRGLKLLGIGIGLLLCLMWAGCTSQPVVQTGQHAYTFEQNGQTLNYLLYVPADYGKNPLKQWPLLIFLHGSREQGRTVADLERLKAHGLCKVVEQQPDFAVLTENFIVLSPQCPDWQWSGHFATLDALLADLEATYRLDLRRIYLTGLSMGGFGTWQYALKYPNRFAALAPIAGGYRYYAETTYTGAQGVNVVMDSTAPEAICDLKDVPIWVFHGAHDTTVPPEKTSDVLVAALKACGSNVQYTRYPNAGHDSWTETYNNPELYTWLLAQRLPRSGPDYRVWGWVGGAVIMVTGILILRRRRGK